jgi:hypothetical protein
MEPAAPCCHAGSCAEAVWATNMLLTHDVCMCAADPTPDLQRLWLHCVAVSATALNRPQEMQHGSGPNAHTATLGPTHPTHTPTHLDHAWLLVQPSLVPGPAATEKGGVRLSGLALSGS